MSFLDIKSLIFLFVCKIRSQVLAYIVMKFTFQFMRRVDVSSGLSLKKILGKSKAKNSSSWGAVPTTD